MANTGKVKWFNNAKGYGFILADSGGEDLFAHFSSIQMEGYKTLKAGQAVLFDIVDGPKGKHAVNITAAEEDAGQDSAPSYSPGSASDAQFEEDADSVDKAGVAPDTQTDTANE